MKALRGRTNLPGTYSLLWGLGCFCLGVLLRVPGSIRLLGRGVARVPQPAGLLPKPQLLRCGLPAATTQVGLNSLRDQDP